MKRVRRFRRVVLGVSLVALIGAMLLVVRRTGETRRAARELQELGREVERARDRVAHLERRVDSLTSRRRILRVAGEMGFGVPPDSSVHYLPDVAGSAPAGAGEEGTKG